MVWLQHTVPFIGILFSFQRTIQPLPQQYHLINGSLTWLEAQSFCRVKYTDLAAVDNMRDKNELVHALGGHVTSSWIGLRRGKTGRWMWSDGRGPAHYTKWYDKEPSSGEMDGGAMDVCVEMFPEGGWNDEECGKTNAFACYEIMQDGKQRFLFYQKPTSWVNSQELCRKKHTDMVCISSKSTNSMVADVANNWNAKVWIGLFNDAWVWSDGRETSFRFWLSGSPRRGDCASVAASQQGRWLQAPCDGKAAFVCQGGLKEKKMVMRLTLRSAVDLNDPKVSDALLKKLAAGLRRHSVTDFKLSWRRDDSGLVFQRDEPAVVEDQKLSG